MPQRKDDGEGAAEGAFQTAFLLFVDVVSACRALRVSDATIVKHMKFFIEEVQKGIDEIESQIEDRINMEQEEQHGDGHDV